LGMARTPLSSILLVAIETTLQEVRHVELNSARL